VNCRVVLANAYWNLSKPFISNVLRILLNSCRVVLANAYWNVSKPFISNVLNKEKTGRILSVKSNRVQRTSMILNITWFNRCLMFNEYSENRSVMVKAAILRAIRLDTKVVFSPFLQTFDIIMTRSRSINRISETRGLYEFSNIK
jgi:hypothetical protein